MQSLCPKMASYKTGSEFISANPKFTPFTYCLPPTNMIQGCDEQSGDTHQLWCKKPGCDACDGRMDVMMWNDRRFRLIPDLAGVYEQAKDGFFQGESADGFLNANPDAIFISVCAPPRTQGGDGSCVMYCKRERCLVCRGRSCELTLAPRFLRFKTEDF